MKSVTITPRSKQINAKMPSFLKRYFWDVDFSAIDPNKHSTYVIERILDIGDVDATAWLKRQYYENKIKDVIKKTRRLRPKSANYWTIIYNLNPREVLCMTKSFQEKHNLFWR